MTKLMRRTAPTALIVFGFLACHAGTVAGAGLKTTFVRVSLENLRIGHTYNIREMANLPLAVYNTGDEPTDLAIEPTIPIEGETRQGYEPIPDASWVTVSCDSFAGLEPGALATADVLITIPDDDRYSGKRYQAMVWSHTVGRSLVACGLKSEVLFTTSRDRDVPARALSMLPTEIITDAGSAPVVCVKIFNPFDEARDVTLASVPASASPIKLRQGYEPAPDPDLLSIERLTVSVPGRGDALVEINYGPREDRRLAPGRYAFVIAMTEAGGAGPTGWSAVYVTVEE